MSNMRMFLRPSDIIKRLRTTASYIETRFGIEGFSNRIGGSAYLEDLTETNVQTLQTPSCFVLLSDSIAETLNPEAVHQNVYNGFDIAVVLSTVDRRKQQAEELAVIFKEIVLYTLNGWKPVSNEIDNFSQVGPLRYVGDATIFSDKTKYVRVFSFVQDFRFVASEDLLRVDEDYSIDDFAFFYGDIHPNGQESDEYIVSLPNLQGVEHWSSETFAMLMPSSGVKNPIDSEYAAIQRLTEVSSGIFSRPQGHQGIMDFYNGFNTGTRVDLGLGSDMGITGDWTFEAWLNIFELDSGVLEENRANLFSIGSNYLSVDLTSTKVDLILNESGLGTTGIGQYAFQKVAVTSTGGSRKMYIDGVLQATESQTSYGSGTGNWFLGTDPSLGASREPFLGQMRRIAIYTYAKSDSTILSEANREATSLDENLAGFYSGFYENGYLIGSNLNGIILNDTEGRVDRLSLSESTTGFKKTPNDGDYFSLVVIGDSTTGVKNTPNDGDYFSLVGIGETTTGTFN